MRLLTEVERLGIAAEDLYGIAVGWRAGTAPAPQRQLTAALTVRLAAVEAGLAAYGLGRPPTSGLARTAPGRPAAGRRSPPLLNVIKAAQRLGFTLDEVAELLDTGRRRHPTADLRQRAIEKITETDAKIADLTAIRSTLSEVVDARCDSLTNCTCADCPIPFLTIGTATHLDGDPA